MNEFSLINSYFKSISHQRSDVVFGIGDDAACLHVPQGMDLLVSTDTLVAGVHFLADWDAYDIAIRSVNVNVSDMAAMGATPCWISLALTIPAVDEVWLRRFSEGLQKVVHDTHLALVGGDTTRGPMSLTITIHGLTPSGCAVRRDGASIGDKIIVSGDLGGAAQAVAFLKEPSLDEKTESILMNKLRRPLPRVDLIPLLRRYATAAIDISDGLSADLSHILDASHVGACLMRDAIPVHPLVRQIQQDNALDFALSGGDDYELCFTIPASKEAEFLNELKRNRLDCTVIGTIEAEPGLRIKTLTGAVMPVQIKGYSHF